MKPTHSEKTRYKVAVSEGFNGEIHDYIEEKKAYNKAWGKSNKKENGHFIFWTKCVLCGKKKKEHIGNGLCQSCYHKKKYHKKKRDDSRSK